MVRVFAFALLVSLPAVAGEVDEINARIRERGLRWEAADNVLMRLTPEQRQARLMRQGFVPPGSSWARGQSAPDFYAPRATLPRRMDWRDHKGFNWVPTARDQGQCGACWAFATVAVTEILHSWRASEPDPEIDLSEQHLLDCAAASLSCDSGGITWVTPGYYMETTGVTAEGCYPYVSGATAAKGVCQPAMTMSADCQRAIVRNDHLGEITATVPFTYPPWDPDCSTWGLSPSAINEVKRILNERPVGTSMKVYNDFFAYRSGVYEPTTTAGGGFHAVTFVGYDDDDGAWIVRNSWGPDWGENRDGVHETGAGADNGYFRIAYGASCIGMLSFFYEFQEDPLQSQPKFCPLTEYVTVGGWEGGATANLRIANCGGGVLEWVGAGESWLGIEDPQGNLVTSGREVRAGTTYKLRAIQRVPEGGTTGTLYLQAQGSTSYETVEVTASAPPPLPRDAGPGPADAGGTDAGARDAGSRDAGTVDAGTAVVDAGTVPLPPADEGGCGCAGGGAGALAALLALVAARRRRG